MSIKYISSVVEFGLICYNALNADYSSPTNWLLNFLQTSGALQIMSNASISSAEVAYPDSERRSDCCDYSLTTSTSLPERFSEITFSSNCMQELVPGMCFELKGRVPKTSERFSINLTLNNVHKDIALHFNPRLPQSYVVRNSKLKGKWGREEVASPMPFNLHRGCEFIMHILVTEEYYFIAINGRHFASFGHRVPYSKVKGIEIRDVTDVEMEQITINEYPVPLPQNKPIQISFKRLTPPEIDNFLLIKPQQEQDEAEELLPVPFIGRLEERFLSGRELHIVGHVKVLPQSFFINLQDSVRIWPHPNIPLHLNPRFGQHAKKNVMCRNSWLNGSWGDEERCAATDRNAFMPGERFHLVIACHDEQYQILLNGLLIAEYAFRINPAIVNTLFIQGDVKLRQVFGNLLR